MSKKIENLLFKILLSRVWLNWFADTVSGWTGGVPLPYQGLLVPVSHVWCPTTVWWDGAGSQVRALLKLVCRPSAGLAEEQGPEAPSSMWGM